MSDHDALERHIDAVATYLSLARPADGAGLVTLPPSEAAFMKRHRSHFEDILPSTFSMREFDGAEFWCGAFDGGLNGAETYFPDVGQALLSGAVKVSFVLDLDGMRSLHGGSLVNERNADSNPVFYEPNVDRALVALFGFVSEPVKTLRGKVSIFPEALMRRTIGYIDNDGHTRLIRTRFGRFGRRWRAYGGGQWWDSDRVEPIQMAMAVQFNREYRWRVRLGYQEDRTVSFFTDPIGAREVFRLRDLPDGSARRAALRHWVREHWRKRRSDPAEERKVREHLRGATKFTWNGLRCEIMPSADDTARAKGSATRLHR